MQKWPDQCIDLIYLDPPFKSDTNYNILFGTQNGKPAQLQAFEDTWTWNEKAHERVESIKGAIAHPAHKSISGLHLMLGDCGMLSYLSYMAERLAEMKRLLKQTGSIYLHCDPTASHYLKTVMDDIFDAKNFRNEVAWKRFGAHNDTTRGYADVHDVLLFYASSAKATFNKTYEPYDPEYIEDAYRYEDERGRYTTSPLQARSLSGGGYEYTYKGINDIWKFPKGRLEELDRTGHIHWPKRGKVPRRKVYLDNAKGIPVRDVITDIKALTSSHVERLGYPTQKPVALLERIIKASCPPEGIVMDPFCGCGTAVDAARRLKRSWIGIDISSFAIDLIINERLKDSSIPIAGIPIDIASAKKLAEVDRFGFEKWAVNRIPGFVPNQKQVGDGGIDGRATLMYPVESHVTKLALAQVKSGSLGQLASHARDFLRVMHREEAVCGVFVTTEKVDRRKRSAYREFENMGRFEIGANNFPRAQFWSIEEYFDGRFPNLPPMLNPYTGKPMVQKPLI